MRRLLTIFIFCAFLKVSGQESNRILNIKNNLELLAMDNSELNETLKLEINVNNVTLSNFLIAVSKVHKLNLTVSPDLANTTIINNFPDVTLADLLVFLCKEYNLDIDFTGNILSIKRYVALPPEQVEKEINVQFVPMNKLISIDVKNESLEKVFRKIMDVSGENLLFANGMDNMPLHLYMNNVPFDTAMEKLAAVNNLSHTKSRDGFYLFKSYTTSENNQYQSRKGFGRNSNYKVLDTINKLIQVDFKDTSVAEIIYGLSEDLNLDVYTATPLKQAGKVTFHAKNIYYDDLLAHIFESLKKEEENIPAPTRGNNQNLRQNTSNNNSTSAPVNFTFKKDNNIYFFGTADQLSVRNVEVVQMMHRSIEMLSDPSSFSNGGSRSAGRTQTSNVNYFGNSGQNGLQGNNNNQRTLSTRNNSFETYSNGAEALVNILPDDIKTDLDIKIDYELNSFLVSGPSTNIDRFKKFIAEIDKPVPVVLIEVMIIEVKKSSSVETGISWGLGEGPVETQGVLFPTTDVTLGAKTVNRVIGGFDGFGSFNIGKVVPNFFATIKALEANGNIKIRSTPKLSTLNGHRAHMSIGETTYYVITNQSYFGSQIPTTSEIRNYAPIDAELAISIKPLVSGDGQVTLDIHVIQSDFSGERIEDDAPPGLTSREFSSIIRMQNQDLAILGGLEEKIKNDSGSGIPLLARIPVIKWLFSKRKREDTKQKLTILIKPTVIY